MGSGCVIGIPSALCTRKSGPLGLSGLTRGRYFGLGINAARKAARYRWGAKPVTRNRKRRLAPLPDQLKCASVGPRILISVRLSVLGLCTCKRTPASVERPSALERVDDNC